MNVSPQGWKIDSAGGPQNMACDVRGLPLHASSTH